MSRAPTGHPVLTGDLNRALLDRQMLLEALVAPGGRRRPAPGRPAGPGALVAVPRPLVAARPVRPPRARAMLTDRRAVRIAIMRKYGPPGHRRGLPPIRPLHADSSPGAADLDVADRPGRLDLGAVVAAGRALVEEAPLTFRELEAGWRATGPTATRRRSPRRCGRWRRSSSCRPGRCGAGQARWSSPPPSTGWAPLDERRSTRWCCATWRRSLRR